MSVPRRSRVAHWFRRCCVLLLLGLLFVHAPAAPLRAQQEDPFAPYLGRYHPNTTIERRGDELWLTRPPFESQLVDIGGGLLGFAHGYLQGTPLHFASNPDGSASIMLLSGSGQWYEYARSGTPYSIDPALAAALEQVLEQTRAEMNVPSIQMSVSIPGQGEWSGARGLANPAVGIPATPNDQVRVASITKLFVATVALQLVQEGWLQLDQTVEFWLPGLLPKGAQITVRQLLNHTSGVPDYLTDGFAWSASEQQWRYWAPEELVAAALQRGAGGTPGARWSYSNTNYVLLGMIIERVTHYPLHEEIRNRIINQLGLHDTYIEPFEQPPSVVRSFARQRDLTDVNLSFAWAAGNISATTADLVRFSQALFGGALLGPEALALMHEFRGTGSGDLLYGLGLMQDRLNAGQFADGQPRPREWGITRGHTGGLIGSRSVLWYLPERGITLAVNINTMNADPDRVATRALHVILSHTGG